MNLNNTMKLLKANLAGRQFGSDEEVTAANDFSDTQDKSLYLEGIKKKLKSLMKCVEVRGDYVDK